MSAWSSSEIIDLFIQEGIVPDRASGIVDELERIYALAAFHLGQLWHNWVSEEEVKAFMVVPLLLALGWDSRHIKMEYQVFQKGQALADIICFNQPMRTCKQHSDTFCAMNPHAALLIETKKLGEEDTGPALEQAIGYAAPFTHGLVCAGTNGVNWSLYNTTTNQAYKFDVTKPEPAGVTGVLMLSPQGGVVSP